MTYHKLEPISSEKFHKFIQATLCESRGVVNGRAKYWRFDLKRPIQFQDKGSIPVIEIQICLRILSIRVEKYLDMLDGLFPLDCHE